MNQIATGVSIMPGQQFIHAVFPLFEQGLIDVVEWSFDTINNKPDWLDDLLTEYGNSDNLLGHGVHYSLFDANWGSRQEGWLLRLKEELQHHKYNHISEHFGFMTSTNYHHGVPLPVPLNNSTLAIGTDRLKRLQDVVQLPVGIENLAFSFSLKDVKEQGVFIDQLIDSVGGFIILDLHNIYCQAHNFEIDMLALIATYPLDKVREIHVSGGSWQDSIYKNDTKIRRDTHDGDVPSEIFDILPLLIPKCKNLEFVILERLGDAFYNDTNVSNYRDDYLRLRKIVNGFNRQNNKIYGKKHHLDKMPLVDQDLLNEQKKLALLLKDKTNLERIKKLSFKNWDVTSWDMEMIHTAMEITLKWKQV